MTSRGYPITAYALANGLGRNTEEVLSRLRAGEANFSPMPAGTPFEGVCGALSDPLPELPDSLQRIDSRNNRIARLVLDELSEPIAAAVARFGAARVGIAVGSSTGSMDEAEQVFAAHARTGRLPDGFDFQPQLGLETLVTTIRALTGIAGHSTIVSTACSSSGKVFACARRWLELDLVDAVLVGGVDSLCQMTLRGFTALGVLSPVPCRPFSAERSGINIGEGGALLLLEREGAGPRLFGVGESSDAHHMTAPEPEGLGARLAIERALAMAGLEASEIGHVNAHGTGTVQNDAMEAKAIRSALGREVTVVSTKAYTGHLLGAAGATEAIFALQALPGAGVVRSGDLEAWVPASLGADPIDPEIDLDIPLEAVSSPARFVLSNSFAFGGNNVSVLFGAES